MFSFTLASAVASGEEVVAVWPKPASGAVWLWFYFSLCPTFSQQKMSQVGLESVCRCNRYKEELRQFQEEPPFSQRINPRWDERLARRQSYGSRRHELRSVCFVWGTTATWKLEAYEPMEGNPARTKKKPAYGLTTRKTLVTSTHGCTDYPDAKTWSRSQPEILTQVFVSRFTHVHKPKQEEKLDSVSGRVSMVILIHGHPLSPCSNSCVPPLRKQNTWCDMYRSLILGHITSKEILVYDSRTPPSGRRMLKKVWIWAKVFFIHNLWFTVYACTSKTRENWRVKIKHNVETQAISVSIYKSDDNGTGYSLQHISCGLSADYVLDQDSAEEDCGERASSMLIIKIWDKQVDTKL
jgi:hypothetical protein